MYPYLEYICTIRDPQQVYGVILLIPISCSSQSIETDGARGASAFNIEGTPYLFIVNSGGLTRRETSSRLYMVKDDGTLKVVRQITKISKEMSRLTSLLIIDSVDNRISEKLVNSQRDLSLQNRM